MIDTELLLEQLPERRWFGGKGRELVRVEGVDDAVIDDGPPALVVTLVQVHFGDGGSQLYHLPLLVEADGSFRDAFDDVERLRLFGELMAHGATIKGSNGAFHFGGPGLDPMAPPGSSSIRTIGAEQSNTSVVLDEAVIVKLFRRVEWGPNPDLELTRLLTNEGYLHVPAHVGEIIYEGQIDDVEVSLDLGLAQRFIADGTEGWTETVSRMHRFYDAVGSIDDVEDVRAAVEERAGDLLDAIERLGDATASLHLQLSREEMEPDVAPEAVEASDLQAWAGGATSSLRRLLKNDLPQLREVSDDIQKRIDRLRTVSDAGQKLRIHGDYHLGQVMFTPRDWMILDLEGEPARSLEDRRAKQSPLRDMAGMLRSFDYAALAALFERTELDSEEWKRLEPWADAWEAAARERFSSGYLARSHEGRFLPADRDDLVVMLDVFEIDKALYELGYELSHRPDWLRIPLKGIDRVVERGKVR